jgi:hypothetical protein
MIQHRTNGRGALSAAMASGLLVLPMVIALADDPDPKSKTAPKDQSPSSTRAAILLGRVTDDAEAPLANVRVRVTVLPANIRPLPATIRPTAGPREIQRLEARTDAKGQYRLEFPGIIRQTRIVIDAVKPGYRSLAGPLMTMNEAKRLEIGPGTTTNVPLILKPGLYFAGIVVDERGKPIPGVKIHATATAKTARTTGAIERIESQPDGSFELFNYPAQPIVFPKGVTRGAVLFEHPDYIDRELEDVYALPPDRRGTVRVVLETGYQIAGRVFDAAGKPVRGVMVKVVRKDGSHRKATATDANGKFALRGLSEGLTLLSARALDIRQTFYLPMALKSDQIDLEVRLKPISWPAGLKTYTVLGMTLADVTPVFKDTYDLYWERGALILDPGKDSDRLNIGDLAEGDAFWMVGETRIGSVREFVNQILAETAGQNARVRVVYNFHRVDFDGSRTAYMNLTKVDLEQLQMVSDQLRPDPE